jgi:hypothetical protein
VSLAPVVPVEIVTLPRKRGQQSAYTEALAYEILERMSDGESLNAICQSAHMPDERTIRRWKQDDVHGFAARYETARDLLLEKWADEIILIADEPASDMPSVQRNRGRVDARKWILTKLKPERYGDRVDLSVVNRTEKISDEQLDAQLKALMEAKKQGSPAIETILDDRPKTPRMITHRPERLPITKPKSMEQHYEDGDDEEDMPKKTVHLVRRS